MSQRGFWPSKPLANLASAYHYPPETSRSGWMTPLTASTSNMGLAAFPTELLVSIFLETSHDDLAKLVKVCKVFQAVAEPILYRSTKVELWPYQDSHGNLCGANANPPSEGYNNLVTKLSRDTSLCACVKSLALVTLPAICYYSDEGITIVEQRTSTEIKRFLELLPSIKTLSIDAPSFPFILPPLPHLTFLCVNFRNLYSTIFGDESCKKVASEILALYFFKPSLRTMHVENLNHGRFLRRENEVSLDCHNTSPVTDLRLMNWKNNGVSNLFTPLLWPKRLERLVYENGCNRNFRATGSPSLQFLRVVAAMKPQEKSLVEILIATTRDYVFTDSTNMGNLTTFTSLKRLAIPHQNFRYQGVSTGISWMLPPQLEELQLQHLMKRSAKSIEQLQLMHLELLASQKPDRVPALRLVVSWYQPCADQDDTLMLGAMAERIEAYRPKLESITSLFWNVGVIFTWVSALELMDTPFGKRLNAENS